MKHEYIFIKFLNLITKSGKKHKALNILFGALCLTKINTKLYSKSICLDVVNAVKPVFDIKRVRQSSKVIYLPEIIDKEKEINQAVRWIIQESKKGDKRNTFKKNLSIEITACLQGKGRSVKKKEDLYSIILDNRPFLFLLKYNLK